MWQGVALATGYNLKRATVSGGPYAPVTNGLLGASFTDSGLVNGVTYYYILTATNQIGESLPSPEASATPIPSTGTNLTALVAGSHVIISWPQTYVGWMLQTNTLNLVNPSWGDVPASLTNSQIAFPISNPAIPIEFFRLRHP